MTETGGALQLVIIEKASRSAVGTCQLFRHDAASARAELGYALARAWWGRGIMREALSTLVGHAFGAFELRRLEAEVDPENGASNALLVSLGFTCEGRLRQRWMAKGRRYDTNVYGLLREEWS
jgi:ribosomal-protein-alanine N-acetyltransferase